MFFFHGFYNHSLELRRISFVWYSFWHSKTPHFLDSISFCLTNGVQFKTARQGIFAGKKASLFEGGGSAQSAETEGVTPSVSIAASSLKEGAKPAYCKPYLPPLMEKCTRGPLPKSYRYRSSASLALSQPVRARLMSSATSPVHSGAPGRTRRRGRSPLFQRSITLRYCARAFFTLSSHER